MKNLTEMLAPETGKYPEQVTFTLSTDQFHQLSNAAKLHRTSRNAVLRACLQWGLARLDHEAGLEVLRGDK